MLLANGTATTKVANIGILVLWAACFFMDQDESRGTRSSLCALERGWARLHIREIEFELVFS